MRKRIVIADDDKDLVRLLAKRCRKAGYDVTEATDGFEAGFMLFMDWESDTAPDLVILDINMPIEDGLGICEELLRENELALIPVIILTGNSDAGTIQRCEELGAYYVHKSDRLWETLEPMIGELADPGEVTESLAAPVRAADIPEPVPLTTNGREQPTVLLIDDDHLYTAALQKRLEPHGFRVLRAFNGLEGYWMALKQKPHVIVTDYVMPNGYGDYVIGRLKNHPLTQSIPIIVLSGRDAGGRVADHKDYGLERQLQSLGADFLLTKPVDFDVLLSHLQIAMESPQSADCWIDNSSMP